MQFFRFSENTIYLSGSAVGTGVSVKFLMKASIVRGRRVLSGYCNGDTSKILLKAGKIAGG